MAECINLVNRKNITLYQKEFFLFIKKYYILNESINKMRLEGYPNNLDNVLELVCLK